MLLLSWTQQCNSPLARFLGRFYLPSGRHDLVRWSGLSGRGRPFPCLPPFLLSELVGLCTKTSSCSRRRCRFVRSRSRKLFANADAGCLSWMALGRPQNVHGVSLGEDLGSVESVAGFAGGFPLGCGWDPTLRSTTRKAMETFLVEVRGISCESFSGISGGQCTLASMLDSLCS